jgi:hypothetical protein
MTSTHQVARAAAQLHEAAQDVARVIARRSAQAEGGTAAPSIQQRIEPAEDPATEGVVPEETSAPEGTEDN